MVARKETAETNDKGSFDASFLVPESQYGERQVIARDAAGNNATAILTMESDPPDTPKLISPSDGGRVGLVGRVTPTFEWSAVSDDSGVHYRLQIATSANVTATGEFVDPHSFSYGHSRNELYPGEDRGPASWHLLLDCASRGWRRERKRLDRGPFLPCWTLTPMGIHCHHSRNSGAPRSP